MFKNFFKWVIPLFKTHAVPVLKRGAQEIGSQALKTASNIANDTLDGENFKSSLKNRTKEAIDTLTNKAEAFMHPQNGSGLINKNNRFKCGKRKKRIINKKFKKFKKQDVIFSIINIQQKRKMSYLHKHSQECTKSELDLFGVPATQISVGNATIVQYSPVTLNADGPLKFIVPGIEGEYLSLSQIYPYIKVKITKSNGNAIDEQSIVALSNLFLHTMFSQVDVFLNNQKITSSINTYPYRCMLETLMNYGEEAKKTQLVTSMFYKDTAGKMDSIDVKDGNQGLNKRQQTKSTSFAMYGRLHSDICHQNRYLINNVNMNVKLLRSTNNFCLMGDSKNNYEVQIEDALLYVRRVKLSPSALVAHAKMLENSTLKYPLTRVELNIHSISKGESIKQFDNISSSVLPKRVVIALVESEAVTGSYSKNPFNFKHYNLSNISLTVDGQDVAHSPIELNFSENKYIRAYSSLFTALDRGGLDWGNQITKEDFLDGYSLFAFDLSPDKCNGDHFNLIKKGNLRLKLTFKEAVTVTLTCFVYMEYDNMLEITKNRNIIFDHVV